MKFFLREVFINLVTLAFVANIFGGLSYNNDYIVLFFAALSFTAINHFLQPIIKIFLLPINLITLGMFRWLAGVFCLLLLTIVIPEIQVISFQYEGFSYSGFAVPAFHFSTLLSLIAASLLISLVSSFVHWLFKK